MANTMQSNIEQTGAAASEVASTAKDRAMEVAETATDEAKAVAQDAAAHARRVVDETRDRLRTQASEQTDRLTETLREMAGQLRSMVEGRGAAPGMISDLASQLASTANRTASRLDEGGLDAAIGDAKRFARNRPGAFLAMAVGAGFVAARLIKAADTHALAQAAKPSSDAGGATDTPALGAADVHRTIGTGAILASAPLVVES
jgi:vacuolar-type H+-ATPase subunit H